MGKFPTDREDQYIIDTDFQQCIFTLGRRGTGKSYLDESLATTFYEEGFTILDLWASDNYENAFWCIPREDGKTRYPVTLLVPDALTTNQEQLDQFNGVNYTEEQFLKRNPGKLFNCVYPPKKPIYERGIEWLKIVRLPAPTAKPDSEINETIVKIIENTILECRKDRRILVFNPLAFRNETQMYRTLELIVRNLNNVAEKHFQKIEPKDVGKQTRDQLTKVERSWDKMCVLIREMGELAPAKLKGDKSGQSLLTKKAILQFIRKVRHQTNRTEG